MRILDFYLREHEKYSAGRQDLTLQFGDLGIAYEEHPDFTALANRGDHDAVALEAIREVRKFRPCC